MHLAKGPARLRRALSFLCLFAVLGAGSLTLTQCRMVGDRLTGVQVDAFKRKPVSQCAEECKDQLEAGVEAEQELFEANIQACAGDKDCVKAEFERHLRRLLELWREYKACVDNCHHQGGGGSD